MKKLIALIKKAEANHPQIFRAVRLFAFTLAVSALGLFKNHDLSAHTLGAIAVAALEVVFRAFMPAV